MIGERDGISSPDRQTKVQCGRRHNRDRQKRRLTLERPTLASLHFFVGHNKAREGATQSSLIKPMQQRQRDTLVLANR